MSQDLSKQFNKFAGQEVNVTENPFVCWGQKFDRPSLDQNNPLIDELRAEAAAAGFKAVRILLPESMMTMDYRLDRLNVNVAKEEDGKYRIQSNFKAG